MRDAAREAQVADRVKVPVDRHVAVAHRAVMVDRGERAAAEQVEAVQMEGFGCRHNGVHGVRIAPAHVFQMRQRFFDVEALFAAPFLEPSGKIRLPGGERAFERRAR